MSVRIFRLFSAVLLTCAVGQGTGCSSPVSLVEVKGKVKLDDKAMTEGVISFEADPPDGEPPASADIKDGAYTLYTTPGKKLVRISLQKDKATDMGGETEMVPTELVRAEFNSESTKTVEVTRDGPNELDFEAKSDQ
jgi:hypothetical protein